MPTEKAGSEATYTAVPPETDASTRPLNGEIVDSAPESPQHWSFPKSVGRQLLAWTSAVLTVVFLILTAVYGSQTTAVSHVRFLYNYSSHAIFVLSVLSGLTGLFLATTITSAFEKVQWALVSRKDGLQLSKYLSLQAGTGVMGLLILTVGRGHSILSSTRLWSATRLASIILIPAIGILIMSNVNTRMAFEVLNDSTLSLGWGMSLFNASLAKNVSAIADQVVQADISMFLSEQSRSVDITPASQGSIPCTYRSDSQSTEKCQRTYFVPGGLDLAAPDARNNPNLTKADVFLARDQQGYILDFVEGPGGSEEWRFKPSDCEVYGFTFGAFYLCLTNAADNTLHARIVYCPGAISAVLKCRDNTTWYSNAGWVTSLTTEFQRATVAYSISNGTILSHVFSSGATPAPVSAIEMLEGYRSAFRSPRDLSELLALFSDADVSNLFGLYVYPAMVWANLKGAETLGQQNPAIIARAADTLQCLLAIMLYYCQPSLFARALSPYAKNSTLGASSPDLRNFAYDLQALAPPNTEFALAALKYQIVVGRLTLVVYIGLCGFALLLCLMALSWGSCAPSASKVPQTTAFPAWDERFKCRIKYAGEEAGAVLDEDVSEMVGRRLVRQAEESRVMLALKSA